MSLLAAGEGPAPGGAAAGAARGPGGRGPSAPRSAEPALEVEAPVHPLLPSRPAPVPPPELRGELALSFRRPPAHLVGSVGPDGPALRRVAERAPPVCGVGQGGPGAGRPTCWWPIRGPEKTPDGSGLVSKQAAPTLSSWRSLLFLPTLGFEGKWMNKRWRIYATEHKPEYRGAHCGRPRPGWTSRPRRPVRRDDRRLEAGLEDAQERWPVGEEGTAWE
ncbi:uncharacterized protein LOC116658172 isoform X1 [Camelus ferus]|uniref:Uncharacterized protein LOC116658172 isoform X1 n=1 Tax=Camelus ferus TaxID=419612 RepID=A0A8B8RKG5_CAMFR|nr:uncharacterized protein LOC116658172 isoform X1 [Camelus ferus]